MIINQLCSISPSILLNPQPALTAIWSGVKDRLVSIITSGSGSVVIALTSGVVFGISTVRIIDRIFQKKLEQLVGDSYYCHETFRDERLSEVDQLSPQEKNLKNRIRAICASTLLLPVIKVAAWGVPGFRWARFGLFSLAIGTVGFAVGALISEYYTKNSDRKIEEFVQSLNKNNLIKLSSQLDLSYYCDYLRYLNLGKLGKKINENFKDCHTLVLRGCRLTDTDLKNLKKAGWFSYFQTINVSDNPHLTATGLKCIGEEGARTIYTLNLSRTDLTDDDLIQMAESGYFNNLEELIIRDNPRITGKSLIRIAQAQSGFKNLKLLDIGGNSQLLGKGLEEWIEKADFKRLEALGLSRSSITESDLQQMIDKAEWFRNLRGLDLDLSSNLESFPSNISRMNQLSDHCVSPNATWSGASPVYFIGLGLFFRKYSNKFVVTTEFKKLFLNGKIFTNFNAV